MLTELLVSLRPRQWVKNLFVFGGLVFGQKLLTPAVWTAGAAFLIFCGLSGAVYLLNDVADRRQDRLHPDKRHRPVAAGRLSVPAAVVAAVVLIAAGLIASVWLSPRFALAAVAYVVLLSAYSAWLKHLVIVDVLVVAIGFVLRAVAGALAVQVAISGWLLICTILLALFLALGKRRHEVLTLEAEATRHRADPRRIRRRAARPDDRGGHRLDGHRLRALHDVARDGGEVPHRLLPATLPFVLYGVFRYLYLLYQRQLGGNPSDLVLHDRALLINTLLWMISVLMIIYGT